jgi:hypothetical protein
MELVHDDEVVSIIHQIRLGGDDRLDLIDDLVRAIRKRKIMLKYTTGTSSKCIFLTRSTIWKLRSFFINKTNDTFLDDKSAEYLNDVFVESICSLELYLVN